MTKEKELLLKIKNFGAQVQTLQELFDVNYSIFDNEGSINFDLDNRIENLKILSKEIEPFIDVHVVNTVNIFGVDNFLIRKINRVIELFDTDSNELDSEYEDDIIFDILIYLDTLYYYYQLLETSIEKYIEDEENGVFDME